MAMNGARDWMLGGHRFRASLRYVASQCGEAEFKLTARGFTSVRAIRQAWHESIGKKPSTCTLQPADDDGAFTVLPVSLSTSQKGKCAQMTLVPLARCSGAKQ